MSRSEQIPGPLSFLGPLSRRWRAPVRRAGAVLLAWTVVSVVAGLQVYLAARIAGDPVSPGTAWSRHLPILALWAVATPLVLASARRFPVRREGAVRALGAHVFFGTLFIVAANLLIRLPELLPGGAYRGGGDLFAGTLEGLVRWYPLALVVYGAIVAVGHRVGNDGSEAAKGADRETASVARASRGGRSEARAPRSAEEAMTGGASRTREREAPEDSTAPLPLRTGEGIRLLRPEEVEWIEADGNYVVVHSGGGVHRARGRISELEETLEEEGFARVHRSALVRVDCIRELRPLSHGDMEVVLAGGETLRLSRGRRAMLEERLGVEL